MARPLTIGQSWILTVDDDRGFLWRYLRPEHDSGQLFIASLHGAEANDTGNGVEYALMWSLPLLWATPPHRTTPMFAFEAAWPPCTQVPPKLITGRSCGLGLLVARASAVYGLPPAPDVFACATIDQTGRLGRVDGLALKLAAARHRCARPSVVVSQDQPVPEAADSGLDLHRFHHARDALRLFFPSLDDHLLSQPDLAPNLFDLAHCRSDTLASWRPVADAARLVAEDQLRRHGRADWAVRYAGAVAARHHDNGGTVDLPPSEWLATQPRSRRRQVCRHLVQQATDAGEPDRDVIREWALAQLDATLEEEDDLRLAGAISRLEAVTGRFEEALQRARDCAERWWRRGGGLRNETSYPLCVWLRLAGALGDHESFRASCDLAAEYASAFPDDRAWVDVACAFGHLALGNGEAAARLHERLTRGMRNDPATLYRLGRQVQLTRVARRSLVAGDRAEATEVLDLPLALNDADVAQLALTQYTESALSGPPNEATLLNQLAAAQRGVFDNLADGHQRQSRGLTLGEYVARFWPY